MYMFSDNVIKIKIEIFDCFHGCSANEVKPII